MSGVEPTNSIDVVTAENVLRANGQYAIRSVAFENGALQVEVDKTSVPRHEDSRDVQSMLGKLLRDNSISCLVRVSFGE